MSSRKVGLKQPITEDSMRRSTSCAHSHVRLQAPAAVAGGSALARPHLSVHVEELGVEFEAQPGAPAPAPTAAAAGVVCCCCACHHRCWAAVRLHCRRTSWISKRPWFKSISKLALSSSMADRPCTSRHVLAHLALHALRGEARVCSTLQISIVVCWEAGLLQHGSVGAPWKVSVVCATSCCGAAPVALPAKGLSASGKGLLCPLSGLNGLERPLAAGT